MKRHVGYLTEETKQSLCVYRYRDMDDGIIKYVGIVRNGLLCDRIMAHFYEDKWAKEKVWEIDFFKCDTQSEVEAFEAHLIALYGTDRYYNIQKSGWGINKYLPDVEDWWKPALKPTFADSETLRAALALRQMIRDGEASIEDVKNILECFEYVEYYNGKETDRKA